MRLNEHSAGTQEGEARRAGAGRAPSGADAGKGATGQRRRPPGRIRAERGLAGGESSACCGRGCEELLGVCACRERGEEDQVELG